MLLVSFFYADKLGPGLELNVGCCPVSIKNVIVKKKKKKNVIVNIYCFFFLLLPHDISFLIEFWKQWQLIKLQWSLP